jgi:hypothetical protein
MSFYDDTFDLDDIVKKKLTKKERKLYDKVMSYYADQERELMKYEQHTGHRYVAEVERRLQRLEHLAANPPPPQYGLPPVYGPAPTTPETDILNLLSGKRLKDESKDDTA